MWRYDDIAIVVTVAEKGSFVAAAEALSIPSSTLSRRVSELESQLGLRLFERNTRSLKLTPKGGELVERCSEHVQSLQKAMRNLSTEADAMAGVLRVSAPITLADDLMSACFGQFIERYPNIKLALDVSNEYSALFDDAIDVALRVGPLKDSDLIAQKLFSTDMVLCASADFITQNRFDKNDINSLEGLPFLPYLKSTSILLAKETNTNKKHTIKVTEKFSSNNTQVLKRACIQGLGLACLPQISAQEALDKKDLVRVFTDYQFDGCKTVYAAYPSKVHLPKKLSVFIEHIKVVMNQK